MATFSCLQKGINWQQRLQKYFSDGKISAAIIVKSSEPLELNDERGEEEEVVERREKNTREERKGALIEKEKQGCRKKRKELL